VLYDQFGWGIHAYAEGSTLSGFLIEGNAAWNNGAPAAAVHAAVLVGGNPARAERVTVRENMAYVTSGLPGFLASRNLEFGWGSQNADILLENNVASGADFQLRLTNWSTAIVRGNRFVSAPGRNTLSLMGTHAGWSWAGNTWYQEPTAAAWFADGTAFTWSDWKTATGLGSSDLTTAGSPSGAWIFVRQNPYEPGRGMVVIYNWDGAATVNVDLTSIAPAGQPVELRRAEQPFGPPLTTISGGNVALPLAAVAPPVPLPGWRVSVPTTGQAFAVFLVSPAP